jgi:predicted nucleic acid-binding protein
MPAKTTASTSRFLLSFMPDAERYGSGTALVFDTSAWNRRTHPTVLPRWATTRDEELLAVCPIVALELLAAARDEQAFQDLDRALHVLPDAPVTRSACDRALGASRELRGERRLPAADYMIAAAAAERGFAVLHYDRHFDPLCRVLGIESIWIAEPGSIG